MHTNFGAENLKGKDHSEEFYVDWRKTLECILGKEWEGVELMHLDQDWEQWRALVNMVKDYMVP
jgi:hypothetical protein